MRALIQRSGPASVRVNEVTIGAIDRGLVVLLGFTHNDSDGDLAWIVRKTTELRIFEDDEGRMNRDVRDVGGSLLLVSQFTLYADCRRGRRPAFTDAMEPDRAESMWERAVAAFASTGLPVATGRFGAMMQVALVNDGPVTIALESPRPGVAR